MFLCAAHTGHQFGISLNFAALSHLISYMATKHEFKLISIYSQDYFDTEYEHVGMHMAYYYYI